MLPSFIYYAYKYKSAYALAIVAAAATLLPKLIRRRGLGRQCVGALSVLTRYYITRIMLFVPDILLLFVILFIERYLN